MYLKKKDDDVFVVPQHPVLINKEETTSSQITKASSNVQPTSDLNYKKPEWSSVPRDCADLNSPDCYYLEVIKNGAIVEKIKLDKEFVVFGRLEGCDVLCEHPTLSRRHAILQYSDGQLDEKYPKGFYLFDLNSTHGTFLNKTRLEPNKYTYVDIDNVIKFAQSTRLYILHGPARPVTNGEDLKINLTHEQMKKIKERYDQISVKLKVRKELQEEEELEKKSSEKTKGIDWGMQSNQDDDADGDENDKVDDETSEYKNPFSELNQVDESYYSDDPRKALTIYFDRENEYLEYEVDESGPGKYTCKIRLPILNDMGEYVYAECEHRGKKKECMAACALEACRILNAHGVLKQSHGESAKRKKEKDWQSADYYDSDEDTYLDRTGDIERKRIKRMQQAGLDAKQADSDAKSNKVHSFESLKCDMSKLIVEKLQIEEKLNKCKEISKAIDDDDIDAYINSLKTCELDTITRAQLRRRVVEITNQIGKCEKLLKVAKPSGFEIAKWKQEIENETKANLNQPKPDEKTPVPKIEPPKVEVPKTPAPNTDVKMDQHSKESKEIVKPPPVIDDQIEEKPPKATRTETIEVTKASATTTVQVTQKRKIARVEPEYNEQPYESNDQYAVWMPPQSKSLINSLHFLYENRSIITNI